MTEPRTEPKEEFVTLEARVKRIPIRAGSLDLLMKFASGFAEFAFNRDGIIYPLFHAENATEAFVISPGQFAGDHKDGVAAMLAKFFAEKNIERFVFVDEAWTLNAVRPNGVDPAEMEKIRREGISAHPDRREVVMIHGQDINEMRIISREILRPKDGKPTLGPVETLPTGHTESRWAILLSHLNKGKLQ